MNTKFNEHEEYVRVDGRDYRCLFYPATSGGYSVRCPTVPPAFGRGATLAEARAEIAEEIDAWHDVGDGYELPLDFGW